MGGERHTDGVKTVQATAEDLASYARAQQQLAEFSAPVLLDRQSPNDRLFVAAFDGTGNSRLKDAPDKHTNVVHIFDQIVERSHESRRQQGYSPVMAGYVEGVGTQRGIAGMSDLISGHTYEARLEEMYLQFSKEAARWMRENPDAEIRLASIGFSRGAEQAAGFTRMVEERGIQNPDGAIVSRGRDGLIDRVEYTQPPLREPGAVVQAAGLFDPVGTGTPRHHDRRLAESVVSGFQITAAQERRNLFQGTRIMDPGVTEDGRFLNVEVAGAHSNIGASYRLDGLSTRSGNLMVDYLNSLSSEPFLDKREVRPDPARDVIHRSEDHQLFYRTSIFDRKGERAHQEELSPATLCRIDCRDAMPRNEAMAAGLAWRPVQIGPVPGDPAPPSARIQPAGFVDRLLEAAKRGDDAAISGMSRDHLQDDPGKAWLESGRERLQQQEHARPHVPEQVDRSYQAEGVGVAR